jgi:AcrR family transcriptional regulator
MAKTKSDLDRKEKEQHILTVARRMLLEAGYEGTSMNRLAEEAQVAPNTIYWYFTDKDALLVGVLNALLLEALRDYEKRKAGPLEGQVSWLLGELESVQGLIATVHARVPVSEVVRTWHANFHQALETLLRVQLQAHGVESADLEHACKVAIFVIEGLLAHPTPTKQRRAMVRWLVSKVLPDGEDSGTG